MTFMIHLQLCMVRILKVPPGYKKKKKSKLKTPISFLSDTVKEKAVIKMLIAFKLPTAPWAKLKT